MKSKTLSAIISDIKRFQAENHGAFPPLYLVSDAQWREVARDHIGGPWLGGLMVCNVPLVKISGQGQQAAKPPRSRSATGKSGG